MKADSRELKICVVTPLFALSGVPLAQIRFARALAGAGHDVDLVIGQIGPEYNFPDIADVHLINMDKPNVRSMFLPVVRYFRTSTPDVIFSAEDHLNAMILIAAIVTGISSKISCSSRVTPFDTYSNVPLTKRWVLKQLMRIVMFRANALTCVSRDMVDQYKKVFTSPPHVCVYNIVDDPHSRNRMKEPVDDEWFVPGTEPLLVAAGQLAEWKGFPDLIHAIGILIKNRKVKLAIFGDGPMRSDLQALIDEMNLGSCVRLFGYVENPLKYFSQADIFVLSSYVEGLPNVLVEAMMCGCTPVSTDCPTGPREVLEEGKFGYLVPVKNPTKMAAGIERAINSPIPKELLVEAIEPFSERIVLARHFAALGIHMTEETTSQQ